MTKHHSDKTPCTGRRRPRGRGAVAVREQHLAMYGGIARSEGEPAAAAALLTARQAECNQAAPCGWLCVHLVKGPGGVSQVHCVKLGVDTSLAALLKVPSTVCPIGAF